MDESPVEGAEWWLPEWRSDLDDSCLKPSDGIEPPYSPAQMRPSGWLALELDTSTLDVESLDDREVVDAIVGFDRVASWASARQARLLAEFARRRPGDDPQAISSDRPAITSRYAPDEIGLALNLSRGTAMSRLAQATQLARTLPDTLIAWEEGRLDLPKVRAITDATCFLAPDLAADVQDRVLARAPEQTAAQLRAALARAVLAADPEGAAARHREARKDRRVSVGQESEGMATLWAMLSAPDATSAYQWLTRLARGLGADDPRGMDARRADLLADLLTGGLTIVPDQSGPIEQDEPNREPADGGGCVAESGSAPSAGPEDAGPGRTVLRPVAPGKPLVHVVMPFGTLTGADDQPCELVGYGAIPADVAREIAADAVWRRLVTDPQSGALLDHGRTAYHPPAALADFVRARDVHCRFPTCRRRAIDAELDHAVRFPDGPTSEPNLWGGCTHHHTLKHRAGWQVTLHDDGRLTWTTPTGHTYTSWPHDYRPDPPRTARPPTGPDVRPDRPRPAKGPPSTSSPWDDIGLARSAVVDGTGDDPPPF